jgi:hypothetical protein
MRVGRSLDTAMFEETDDDDANARRKRVWAHPNVDCSKELL